MKTKSPQVAESRKSGSRESVDPIMNQYFAQARAALGPAELFELEPELVMRKCESVQNELALAQTDGTPELLLINGEPGTSWSLLMELMLDHAHSELGKPEAQVVLKDTTPIGPSLKEALEGCAQVRARVSDAIDGGGVRRKETAELRSHILGSQVPGNTRSAWETDIKGIIAAIRGLGDQVPKAVTAMLPRLEEALKVLDGTTASPGRKTKTLVYNETVREAVAALNLAISDVISWAASTATDKRLASMNRVVMPPPRKSGAAKEAE